MSQVVYLNDGTTLSAAVFNEDMGFTPGAPTTVTWDLADPNGNLLILNSLPTETINGDIVILSQATGGFNAWDEVQYENGVWTKIGQAYTALDNQTASLTIPGDITDIEGVYTGVVHFTMPETNIRKSQVVPFEVLNPIPNVTGSPEDVALERAWQKLEDCFDSTLGGPYLRDATKAFFNKTKMKFLIPDAIERINLTFYPQLSFTETTFDYTTDGPIFTQALLVETIYHLMRAYTEQPLPAGAAVQWFNRLDYANRWKPILEQEEKKLNSWLDIWKTQFLGFGSGSMLIGGYASTALRAPRALRTRLPRYYAGMYRRW